MLMHSKDVCVPEDNHRIIKEAVEKLGGLDVIIANAGTTICLKKGWM